MLCTLFLVLILPCSQNKKSLMKFHQAFIKLITNNLKGLSAYTELPPYSFRIR